VWRRRPAVYAFRQFTEDGGLLSYGNDIVDNYRRAATYVDRILRGANPSELSIQAPVKFELVINLKTAKVLGLDVPLQLQQRADEVIRGGCALGNTSGTVRNYNRAHNHKLAHPAPSPERRSSAAPPAMCPDKDRLNLALAKHRRRWWC
jgi:hypothetical protein